MKKTIVTLVAITAIVAFASLPLRSEVTVYGEMPPVSTLISGSIVDDPDPVGPIWDPNGPVGPGTLQGNGGRPDVVLMPDTGVPLVVWAEEAGFDHDIAFSMWTGSGWSATEFLTSGPAEELAPRIFVEADGTLHVVWCQVGAKDEAFLSTRPPGSSWTTPVRVSHTSESARRPSVSLIGDELWVAYERDSSLPGMAQDIIVARQRPAGGWNRTIVSSTPRSSALDVLLHHRSGLVWLDWKHGDDQFGYVEHDGSSWGSLAVEPWTDRSWVGEEEMRKILAATVIGP